MHCRGTGAGRDRNTGTGRARGRNIGAGTGAGAGAGEGKGNQAWVDRRRPCERRDQRMCMRRRINGAIWEETNVETNKQQDVVGWLGGGR